MKTLRYESGQAVEVGDQIAYHDEAARVEFVVAEAVGDPIVDWYLEEFPRGGVMIRADSFGNVFLDAEDMAEHLVFLARGKQPAQ